MVLKIVLFVALAVSASARRPPNANYAEGLLKNSPASRMSSDIEEDINLDAPGLVAKYGYPIEVHNVITSDGYILEMHRIPHGRDHNNKPDPKKIPVLVMHGLLSSSADFIVLGPGNALAYLLAEAGYDVWLGNARGNFYSRKHRSLNPDSSINHNFWRFSWDEIGNIDLAAFVDFILDRTGHEKLHYIGHSQGGTTFLVLNSLQPKYNEKFISFQGLAPASYFEHNEVALFNSLAPHESTIETTAFLLGQPEIFGNRDFVYWIRSTFCNGITSLLADVCDMEFDNLLDPEHYNATMIPLFLSHAPAGASVRQVAHYGQTIRFKAFRRYNHNSITNLGVYGSFNPPAYDLSKVTVPSYLHYGQNDKEVHFKDLLTLAATLPNVVGTYKVERDTFNHFDFIWGRDVREQLYERTLIPLMKQAERRL
ncbi:unnamed protein product [Spodoptera exigua]|uniref:Lipase n=1 Tax=Spodoptera exigua TaxID=7107 RepID=A0A835GEA1_SPOEX|nr:hypothetical protein HW555_008301 [Spodoptera exigua]CAH0701444.1 unnamed protein product [Spodoptera exigua]